MAKARRTTPPEMPACTNSPAFLRSTATSCGAALSSDSGPRTRPARWFGSSWFADRNWDRVREHAVAYMMIDQPGMLGTTRWSAHSTAELRSFHQTVEGRTLRNRIAEWHKAPKTGDSSFFGAGIPTFWAEGGFTPEELQATANATCGWWHHSLESTFDKIDWDWMAEHIRIYGAYLWELCTAPILAV